MEKQQERVAPFSSDECPNSGEDSEEDEVIDYSHNSIINGALANLNLHGTIVADTHYTKDNTVITMSEKTNEKHSLMPGSKIHNQPNPLVPIISVTPQSPGLVKHYPVLDENLQHLHDIYDNVQRIRMQDPTLNSIGHSNRMYHHEEIQTQRLSWSCPSLQHLVSPEVVARLHDQAGGSEPDLLTNCSNNSSPTHFSGSVHNHAQILQCIDRRRSWTDLENTKQNYRRCSAQNFFQAQNIRQRSVSLSSLDGEVDLELDGKHRETSTNVTKWTCRSQASTHSLNEADFVQSAFKKGTSKRGNPGLGEAATLLPGVVGTRVTLQKSVSTPSIVTPPGLTHFTDSGTLTTPLLTTSERVDYGDAAVGYVEINRDDGTCIVRGRVCPEHKVRETGYTVISEVDEEEETINLVECQNCPASAGGCKHGIACIMWLQRRSEEPAPTSTTCYWKKPPLARPVTHVKYIKIEDMKNKSKEVEVGDSSTFLDLVLEKMKKRNQDCQLSRHFIAFDIKRNVSIHQIMIRFRKGNSTEVTDFLELAREVLTPELCVMINKATLDQYKTQIWGKVRYGRVTASKIYELAQCKTPNGSLVEQIMGVAKIRDTDAMERGRLLEKEVRAAFEESFKTEVKASGLLLDVHYPVLGASPDEICEDFVVEVKCPASVSASSRYVNKGGKIASKFNGQLQLQMLMAKAKCGKFLVASHNFEKAKRFSLYDVQYDEQFTVNLIEKAMNFWKANVFPLLLKSIKETI